MRNLSISFYTKSGSLSNTTSNINHLIEVEECYVAAEGKKFNIPDYVELVLKPSRSQVLDELGSLIPELSDIDSIVLVITNQTNLFWSQVLPMYEKKTPMVNENQTDMESMASFRTLNTVIESHEKKTEAQESLKQFHYSAPVVARKISEDLFSTPELQALEVSKLTRVKMERGVPRKSLLETKQAKTKESVYNDIPRDEESLPCASKFFSLKRVQRQSQSQSQVIENTESTVAENPEDLTWKPKASKKRAAVIKKEQPAKKPRRNNKTNIGYSDVDDEVKKSFGNEVFEPLSPLVAEPKRTPRPRAAQKRITKNKKNANDFCLESDANIEVIVVKTNAQLRREADNTLQTQKKLLDKQTDCVLIEEIDVDEDQRGKDPVDEGFKQPIAEAFKKPIAEAFKKPVAVAFKKPPPPKSWFQVKTEEKVGNKKNVVQDRRSTLEQIDQIQKKQLPTKPTNASSKKLPTTKSADVNTKKPVVADSKKLPTPKPNKKKPLTPPELSTNLSDFDKLCKEKQTTTSRLALKRPAVKVEKEPAVKKTKVSPAKPVEKQFNISHSPPTKEISKRQDLLESDKENEPEFVSFIPQEKRETKFDYTFYNSRPMLRKYIEEVETSMCRGKVVTTSRRISQMIQNSEVDLSPLSQSQKKTSPTINIRNVQIQEISITSPRDDEMVVYGGNNNFGVGLGQKLEVEAEKSIGPLMEVVKNLMKDFKEPEAKQRIIEDVKECRSNKERFRIHIDEHVKLLKRLHHSKRKLTQLFNEDIDSINKLRKTVKEVVSNNEKSVEENVHKVETVRHEAFQKQKEVIDGVWGGYAKQVYREVNNVLKTHLNLDD